MATYKKVLVAIDLSDESEQVLEAAADIAAVNAAELSVIHITENSVTPYSQSSGRGVHVSENQIRESLFASLSELVEAAGLSKSLIHIDFGRPIDLIIDRAKTFDADLIVIGSHGRHGLKLLLGSTANGVLHYASCDVLAVRVRDIIEQK